MTTAVDEAMAAALETSPSEQETSQKTEVVQSSGHGETVDSRQGPISADQAEKLIKKSLRAARTFSDVMNEIIDRRVWEALEYASPRAMIRDRFAGKLFNPATGKPYTNTAVNRLSNSAWVVWSLSEVLEIPASELHVLTSVLARVPAGLDERYHQQLVDNIVSDVDKYNAQTVDEINAVIDVHVSTSADNTAVTQPADEELLAALDAVRPEPESVEGEGEDNDKQASGEEGNGNGADSDAEPDAETTAQEGGKEAHGEFVDEETWLDADRDPSTISKAGRVEDNDADDAEDRFAEEAFDEEFARGSQAPDQAVTWEQALNAQRSSEAVAANVGHLAELPQAVATMGDAITQLSTHVTESVTHLIGVCKSAQGVAGVKDADGLFDALSDEELEELRDKVVAAIDTVPMITAVSQALSSFEGVEGAPSVAKAIKAADSAADAVANLEEFSTEIDFVLYP